MPPSHPEVCREELEAEEKRRRLVEQEGALFVPLSLVDLCVRLVRRLATLESAFWEGIERQRLPTALADTLKTARPHKRPYEVVAMSSVPPEHVRVWSFPVHPAKLTKPTFWFSVDLVRGVVDYLRVLAAVSSHRELTDQRCVRSAIERYRHHLARVAALHKKHPGRRPEDMPRAPLDVEMVWLAHMTRTKHYREVCELNFGALVDHRLPATTSLVLHSTSDPATSQDWRRLDADGLAHEPAGTKDGLGVDLAPGDVINDQAWLAQFVSAAAHARARWEGRPPQRPEPQPIQRAAELVEWFIERLLEAPAPVDGRPSPSLADQLLMGYEKMIYLVARHPHRTRKEFSPPFLVDLVWHVHQAHPVAYRRDMTRVAGVVLEHHPWPKPAESGSGGLSQRSAVALWKEEFSVDSFHACELTHLFRS